MSENRHSIRIEAAASVVYPEIIRWGEAAWWPKKSLMRFERGTSGTTAVQKGTRYRQRVLLPFAPCWDVEVSDVTGDAITRRFLNGMFSGQETVRLKEQGKGVAVDYVMDYGVNGVLNRLLWKLVFRRLHDENIEAILAHLKAYAEKKV